MRAGKFGSGGNTGISDDDRNEGHMGNLLVSSARHHFPMCGSMRGALQKEGLTTRRNSASECEFVSDIFT